MKYLISFFFCILFGFYSLEVFADTKIFKGSRIDPSNLCIHEKDDLEEMKVLASEGDSEAAFCVGQHYRFGTPRNSSEAVIWLRNGANLGSRKAQSLLAQELEPTMYKEAVGWYVKAAMQGDEFSLHWLAIKFYHTWLKDSKEETLLDSYVMAELAGWETVGSVENGRLKSVCLKSLLNKEQLMAAEELIKSWRKEIPNLPEITRPKKYGTKACQ